MLNYQIKHITRYTYTTPVIDSANQVMLFPIDDEQQKVKNHELIISYEPSIEVFNDYFGNQVGIFSVIRPHTELTIQSDIEVAIETVPLPLDNEPAANQWEQLLALGDQFPFMDFLILKSHDPFPAASATLESILDKSLTPFIVAQNLSKFIFDQFEYKKGITNVETNVEEIWELKAGVCQDFAHVLLVMLRMIGIPARYVSGYICPKNHDLRGEGATHAWVDAYLPFHGWIGLDPTNNCIVSDRHVRLAIGRNFMDCTPVKGTYKGSSEHILEVSVTIENGAPKKSGEFGAPVFTYQVKNPGVQDNSYRRFMEIQQQQ